jgi:D-proline reductase (dithiol) PrdB
MSQASFDERPAPPPGTTHTTFVRYIDRTREYYEAQGFEHPYRWAAYDDAPFTALSKPLAESVVALITTANEPSPRGWQKGDRRPLRRVHSFSSSEPPQLYTDDLSWHKGVTNTDDIDSYLPVHRLAELAEEGRIGSIARRCHGVPTEYSQRRTTEQDAPEILRRCREDGADVALLVPL